MQRKSKSSFPQLPFPPGRASQPSGAASVALTLDVAVLAVLSLPLPGALSSIAAAAGASAFFALVSRETGGPTFPDPLTGVELGLLGCRD